MISDGGVVTDLKEKQNTIALVIDKINKESIVSTIKKVDKEDNKSK